MNKTVTINIAGLVFHIEEDAYERLRSYLDRLHAKFSAEEGRDEILHDIESRIAEILTEKKGPSREVVLMKDIDEVIAVMGEPEAISEEGAPEEQQDQSREETRADENARRRRRRLFRDPDDKVIGGVCTGLGHYFDIDPVWIRLVFAALFCIFGTGILFYILLMIVIPKAETTAEKLEMRGDPVDVNNISRSIKEEFEEFGERMRRFGKEARDWGKPGYDNNRNRSRYHRNRRGAEDIFYNIGTMLGRFVSFCLVIVGILLLIGLLIGAFSITDFGPDMISTQVRNFFEDETSYHMAIAALLLVFGMPIIMMIYSGVIRLFRLPKNNKVLGFTALGIWIIGIIMAVYAGMNIASGFSETSQVAERVPVINAHRDTLSIKVRIDPTMLNSDYEHSMGQRYHYGRHWRMFSMDTSNMKFSARLNIVPSTSDSIELVVYKKAQGRSTQEAHERVMDIRYEVDQDSSAITFPASFTLGENKVWKAQELETELRIPVGTVIFIDGTCEGFIYDIYNVTDTYDYDMVDRRWKMTSAGLACVDCAGLKVEKENALPASEDSIKTDSVR